LLAPHDIGEIHLLQIDIHAGAAELFSAGSRQIADFAGIGRRHHDDFLILVAGLRERPLYCGIVAWAAQHLNADIGGKRRAGAEQTDIVPPITPIIAGDRRHRLRRIDGTEQRSPYHRIVEWRIALVEVHRTVGGREMRDDGDVGVAADLVEEIS
jgi:hypothetical protein